MKHTDTLGRGRTEGRYQENQREMGAHTFEIKTSLVYTVSSRTARAIA